MTPAVTRITTDGDVWQFQKVKSSNIDSIAYSPAKSLMLVRFRDGAIYEYADVPAEKHTALMAAPSIGRHLAQTFGKGRRLSGAEVQAL